MHRREAVQYISLLLGGTLVGANAFLTGCKTKSAVDYTFTNENIAFLNEVGETILPATSTPGAKAANVGEFMKVMVNDCYTQADQKIFHEGLAKLDDASNDKNGKSFMESTSQQRHDLLVELDKKVKDYNSKINVYTEGLTTEQRTAMVLQKNFCS